MSQDRENKFNRRAFLSSTMAATGMMAAPAFAQNEASTTEMEEEPEIVRRNISSFRSLQWQPYFENLRKGAILVDTTSRALHYWSEDESIYKLYPTSVPLTEEMTRRGRTRIVRKVEGPSWAPCWFVAKARERRANNSIMK